MFGWFRSLQNTHGRDLGLVLVVVALVMTVSSPTSHLIGQLATTTLTCKANVIPGKAPVFVSAQQKALNISDVTVTVGKSTYTVRDVKFSVSMQPFSVNLGKKGTVTVLSLGVKREMSNKIVLTGRVTVSTASVSATGTCKM